MSEPRPALLERFDRRVDEGGRRALLLSIARNLGDVLGAVAGSSLATPDLGMPPRDVLIQMCPDELALVRRLIEENAKRFEPRLQRVSVDVIEEPDRFALGRQRFLLRAALTGTGQAVQLAVAIDGRGLFRVEVEA